MVQALPVVGPPTHSPTTPGATPSLSAPHTTQLHLSLPGFSSPEGTGYQDQALYLPGPMRQPAQFFRERELWLREANGLGCIPALALPTSVARGKGPHASEPPVLIYERGKLMAPAWQIVTGHVSCCLQVTSPKCYELAAGIVTVVTVVINSPEASRGKGGILAGMGHLMPRSSHFAPPDLLPTSEAGRAALGFPERKGEPLGVSNAFLSYRVSLEKGGRRVAADIGTTEPPVSVRDLNIVTALPP